MLLVGREMKKKLDKTDKTTTKGQIPDDRLPYETPRIIYREPLEAVSVACLPSPPAKGNAGACPQGPASS